MCGWVRLCASMCVWNLLWHIPLKHSSAIYRHVVSPSCFLFLPILNKLLIILASSKYSVHDCRLREWAWILYILSISIHLTASVSQTLCVHIYGPLDRLYVYGLLSEINKPCVRLMSWERERQEEKEQERRLEGRRGEYRGRGARWELCKGVKRSEAGEEKYR